MPFDCEWRGVTPPRPSFFFLAAVVGTVLAICAVPLAHASDPVPVQVAPTDDTLSAAKRELDGLKTEAATGSADVPRGALPSISIPQFSAPAPIAPVTSAAVTTDRNGMPKRESSNWLVDAMMKPKEGTGRGRDRARGDTRVTSRESGLFGNETISDEDDSQTADGTAGRERTSGGDQTAADEQDKRASKDTFNPLAHYMANWLSPQDSAMLRRTIDFSASPDTGTGNSLDPVPTVSGDTGNSFSLPGVDVASAAPGRSFAPLPKPEDNPYLQFLSTPEPPPPNVPPPSPAPVYTPPPSFEPTPTPAPQNSPIPDFVRPTNDEKYFKPLKRF